MGLNYKHAQFSGKSEVFGLTDQIIRKLLVSRQGERRCRDEFTIPDVLFSTTKGSYESIVTSQLTITDIVLSVLNVQSTRLVWRLFLLVLFCIQ